MIFLVDVNQRLFIETTTLQTGQRHSGVIAEDIAEADVTGQLDEDEAVVKGVQEIEQLSTSDTLEQSSPPPPPTADRTATCDCAAGKGAPISVDSAQASTQCSTCAPTDTVSIATQTPAAPPPVAEIHAGASVVKKFIAMFEADDKELVADDTCSHVRAPATGKRASMYSEQACCGHSEPTVTLSDDQPVSDSTC